MKPDDPFENGPTNERMSTVASEDVHCVVWCCFVHHPVPSSWKNGLFHKETSVGSSTGNVASKNMNSQANTLWRSPFIAICLQFFFTNGKLVGDNICITQDIYLVNVTETYTKNVTVRDYQWCYNVPPRCSLYTSRNITDTRIVEKNQTRTDENCCPGYTQVNYSCILSCTKCQHGVCKEGTCICFSGFKGSTCDVACDYDEWGPNCSRKCDCDHHVCDSITGCKDQEETISHSTSTTEEIAPVYFPTAQLVDDKQLLTLMTTTTTRSQTISQKVAPSDETAELLVENSLEPPEPKMEARREMIRVGEEDTELNDGYRIPVELHFGDQVQQAFSQATTTTDQNMQEAFTFVFRKEVSYQDNANRDLLSTYLKLLIPLVALVILIAIILGIYLVTRMSEIKFRKGERTRAVRTTSILNDPLPDPPITEEELNLTSTEYRTTKTIGAPTFVTQIIHNKEQIPSLSTNDCRESLYDHPRPTRSCRAASLVEPIDFRDVISTTSQPEPVYDEILIENPFLYIH